MNQPTTDVPSPNANESLRPSNIRGYPGCGSALSATIDSFSLGRLPVSVAWYTRRLAITLSLAAWLVATSGAVQTNADPIPTAGLIGYWTGNGTAADSSPIGNNGSFGGNYVPGAPGGKAFDLATGKVVVPDNPVYDFHSYSGWTVGFWFNTNRIPISSQNGTSNRTFLGQDDGSGFRPKWLIDYGSTVFGPNNDFVLHLNDFNQERIFIESDPVTIPSGWNQLTVTVDNNSSLVDFYLNGLSIGAADLPGYVLQPSAPLIFGAAEPGLSYSGLLNNVAIYDRALTPQEVSELANPNAAPLWPSASMGLALLIGLGAYRFGRSRLTALQDGDALRLGYTRINR
jgi:hypothetical protein